VVALTIDAALDVGGVRRCHRGFGHGKAGADGAVEQRPEPLPLRSMKIRRKRLGTEWLAVVARRRHRKVGAKLRPTHLFEPGAHFRVLERRGLRARPSEPSSCLLCSDVAGNAPQQAEPPVRRRQFAPIRFLRGLGELMISSERAGVRYLPVLSRQRRGRSGNAWLRQHLTGAFANVVGMTSASRRASTRRSKIGTIAEREGSLSHPSGRDAHRRSPRPPVANIFMCTPGGI
jgi:hypothetical protein